MRRLWWPYGGANCCTVRVEKKYGIEEQVSRTDKRLCNRGKLYETHGCRSVISCLFAYSPKVRNDKRCTDGSDTQ